MLATLWEQFPMENVNRELYFLDSGVVGVCRLYTDGIARSSIQGYDAETSIRFWPIQGRV
jgi:hypothetical protein